MTKKEKKRNKPKHNGLKNTIAILCLFIGLILIFLGPIKEFIISWLGNDYAVSTVDADTIQKNLKKEGEFDFSTVKELDFETVLRARLMREGMNIIGGIAIPSVSLNLPVIKGVDNLSLAVGAGTMKEDLVMGEGNYSLASHRMNGNPRLLFSPLFELKGGETIYLTDLTNIYIYEVSSIEKVDITRIDVIDEVPGKKLVTLVTCDFESDIRLIVQGTLKEKVPMKEASKEAKAAFKLPENGWQ
ncbi:class A sortase [Isobaculum melis]|uniref:Sortase A n=1 Tax=Isobaculum melis TaxID=142588 RepID=A0A1H9U2U0_9LACT|nr:class A sortase [Isobaculum melis]SES03477.1 sortase A [Isobaculum melis]